MAQIYVSGHRNPDMDSIASAIAYSRLKNILDGENQYVPIALGPLNVQVFRIQKAHNGSRSRRSCV